MYFTCCEILGMWDGYMNAVIALLNLFAATGHIHYYHTVPRSERLWAELRTDIVIK